MLFGLVSRNHTYREKKNNANKTRYEDNSKQVNHMQIRE